MSTQQSSQGRKVIVGGEIFFYDQKAPFVVSGESVRGALEWDESADRVKCHECGSWFRSVAGHLTKHAMTARDYKLKHGLALGSALICEGLRSQTITANVNRNSIQSLPVQTSERGKQMRARVCSQTRGINMQLRNKNGSCPAQILETLRRLARQQDRVPTCRDLRAVGIYEQSAMRALGVASFAEVQRLAGLIPFDRRSARYGKELLAELLHSFGVRHHRLPSASDWRRQLLPSCSTYVKAFGSMAQAYYAAGLERLVSNKGRIRSEYWQHLRVNTADRLRA